MVDKFKDECGVFGIFGHSEASNLTYLGLYALQHRGQESAGIAASDGTLIRLHKAMGYVNEAFNSESLAKLPGSLAVGHVRYSTAGESLVANAHPIVGNLSHLALLHLRRAVTGVPAEGAGRRELAELVTDHLLGHEDGHVLAAVVDGDGVADHLREDGRRA